MKRRGEGWTTVDRYMFWLVFQVVLLLPVALGQLTIEQWTYAGPAGRAFTVLLGAAAAFLIVRNLTRLVRAPSREACRSNVIQLVVVGLVFTLFSTGPLIESDRWSVKPAGIADAVIGGLLLLLAVREVRRVRSRRSGPAADDVIPRRTMPAG